MIPHLRYITSWFGRPIMRRGTTDATPNATCEHCGGPIRCDVLKIGRLFCSSRCETGFYNKQRPSKGTAAKTCEHCGETFTAKRTDARYCSARCRQAARRDKARGGTEGV